MKSLLPRGLKSIILEHIKRWFDCFCCFEDFISCFLVRSHWIDQKSTYKLSSKFFELFNSVFSHFVLKFFHISFSSILLDLLFSQNTLQWLICGRFINFFNLLKSECEFVKALCSWFFKCGSVHLNIFRVTKIVWFGSVVIWIFLIFKNFIFLVFIDVVLPKFFIPIFNWWIIKGELVNLFHFNDLKFPLLVFAVFSLFNWLKISWFVNFWSWIICIWFLVLLVIMDKWCRIGVDQGWVLFVAWRQMFVNLEFGWSKKRHSVAKIVMFRLLAWARFVRWWSSGR